jgi:plastocyanin
MHLTKRLVRLAPLALAGTLVFAACGDDDDDASEATAAAAESTSPASDTTAHAEHQTVAVDGIDYGFENLPAEVPAGTMLTFRNTSDKEFHEMVVMRIPDEETRTVGQLAALPPEESDAFFADVMPALVAVAGPGEEGTPVLGDGTITEPGRYAVVCFIPVGADPAAVAEAMQTESSGPPNLGDGPPHVAQGMYGELTVTEA